MPPFNVGYYKGTSFSELKLFIQPCTVNKPVTKWYFDLIIFLDPHQRSKGAQPVLYPQETVMVKMTQKSWHRNQIRQILM